MAGDLCSHGGLHSMISLLDQSDKLSIVSISARATHNSVYAPEVRSLMSTCETVFAPYAAFIPDFSAFCTALQTPRPCCLRVTTLRTTPEAVQALLVSQGFDVISLPIANELLLVTNLVVPGSLREALMGYYHPQAFTSALASLILAPLPGELVCDLCAAPGSKTSHMAQLMHNQGVIVANEPIDARLAMLEYNLKHLGISNVVTTRYSGQNFPLRCKFTRV